MTVYNPTCSPALAHLAFMTRFYILLFLLTWLQGHQVIALPTGNTTRFFPTAKPSTILSQSIWKITTTIQYPPTTILRNTTPGTIGVSGFSFHRPKTRVPSALLIPQGAYFDQIVITSLETQGRPSLQPFPTYTPPPIVLTTAFSQNISLTTSGSRSSIALYNTSRKHSSALWLPKSNLPSAKMERRGATDCFQPVATGALPSQLPSRGDHPVPRLGIVGATYPQGIRKCQRS